MKNWLYFWVERNVEIKMQNLHHFSFTDVIRQKEYSAMLILTRMYMSPALQLIKLKGKSLSAPPIISGWKSKNQNIFSNTHLICFLLFLMLLPMFQGLTFKSYCQDNVLAQILTKVSIIHITLLQIIFLCKLYQWKSRAA